nr:MAG TPA: hypothetical protein [Bacteriophage sp.]
MGNQQRNLIFLNKRRSTTIPQWEYIASYWQWKQVTLMI